MFYGTMYVTEPVELGLLLSVAVSVFPGKLLGEHNLENAFTPPHESNPVLLYAGSSFAVSLFTRAVE